MRTLDLPDALESAGVLVKVLVGWQHAHSSGTYRWRENPEDPAGAMWHHTATSSYLPNRDKANGYLGMGNANDENPRLYQEPGSGRVPIYTLANAQPAPISSGYGVRAVLDDYVKQDVPIEHKQTDADDSPQWAGNTHYWNTEVVLNGTGYAMPDEMWATMVTVADVLNDVFGWTPARHVGHGHHTRRKVDLWDGRFADMNATILGLRDDMGETPEGDKMYLPISVDSVGRGDDIQWLQRALNRAGAVPTLTIDGIYGEATCVAVSVYQNGDGTTYGAKSHDAVLTAAYS